MGIVFCPYLAALIQNWSYSLFTQKDEAPSAFREWAKAAKLWENSNRRLKTGLLQSRFVSQLRLMIPTSQEMKNIYCNHQGWNYELDYEWYMFEIRLLPHFNCFMLLWHVCWININPIIVVIIHIFWRTDWFIYIYKWCTPRPHLHWVLWGLFMKHIHTYPAIWKKATIGFQEGKTLWPQPSQVWGSHMKFAGSTVNIQRYSK